MMVRLSGTHNHSLNNAAAQACKDVSQETRSKLLKLFAIGYSAGDALQELRKEMDQQSESRHQYIMKAADRAALPDYNYVWRYVRIQYTNMVHNVPNPPLTGRAGDCFLALLLAVVSS
mgnify:FL=1